MSVLYGSVNENNYINRKLFSLNTGLAWKLPSQAKLGLWKIFTFIVAFHDFMFSIIISDFRQKLIRKEMYSDWELYRKHILTPGWVSTLILLWSHCVSLFCLSTSCQLFTSILPCRPFAVFASVCHMNTFNSQKSFCPFQHNNRWYARIKLFFVRRKRHFYTLNL